MGYDLVVDFRPGGMQLFEYTDTSPLGIQFTRGLYHLLDVILSVGFAVLPFLLLTGTAFWVAMVGIIIHNISHVLTDWGDQVPFLKNTSFHAFSLKMHTPIDVMFSIPIAWLAFMATEEDGVGPAAQMLYQVVALGVLPLIYPMIVFRICQPDDTKTGTRAN